jgi:hypothetical protein
MKESTTRYKKHINLQNQLLAIAKEKDNQIFEIESHDSTIVEEKMSQFSDIVNHMDVNEKSINQAT